MSKPQPIYLVGGPSGAGKSTLIREIAATLKLNHTLGVGFIREVVKSETDLERDPSLFSYSFQSRDVPFDTLITQSRRLYSAVTACITRAYNEGTSLIIEGTHLLPELYHDNPHISGFIILAAPEADEHKRRILGVSHTKREIAPIDIEKIRTTDGYYKAEAAKYGLPWVAYDQNLDEIIKLLQAPK